MSREITVDELQRATDLTRHKIDNYPDCAYSMVIDGERVCVPAGDVFYAFTQLNNPQEFFNACKEGNPVSWVDDESDSTESYGSGIFCGKQWIFMFKASLVTLAASDSYIEFFYGTKELPEDNLTERMTFSNSIYRTNGHYAWHTGNASEEAFNASPFSFGEDNAIYDSQNHIVTAKTLYFNGKLFKNDIVDYELLTGGILLTDVDNDINFIRYADLAAGIVHPVNGVFQFKGAVISYYKDSFLMLGPFTSTPDFETDKDGVLKYGDIELEYSLTSGAGAFFHVKGYVMHSASGEVIRWAGEKLSMREVQEAGLDSDGFDISATLRSMQTEEPAQSAQHSPRKIDLTGGCASSSNEMEARQEKVAEKTIEKQQAEYATSVSEPTAPFSAGQGTVTEPIVATPSIWDSESRGNKRKVFRTVDIEKLYSLLNDSSLVM